MTAQCGGGASQPKLGFDPVQVLVGNTIGEILVSLGMPELAAVYVAAGVLTYALDVICATDPPPLPTIDAARLKQYYDQANLGPAYPLLLQDAQQLVGHFLWFEWCECVSAPQPTPPPPVAFPPGVDVDRQPVAPAPTGCYDAHVVFEAKTADPNGDVTWDVQGGNTAIGASTVWWSWSAENTGGTTVQPLGVTNYFDQVDATGRVVHTDSATILAKPTSAADVTHVAVRQPGAASVRFRTHAPQLANASVDGSFHALQVCSPPPSSSLPDCCPPDPTLENLIVQVLRLENLILNSLGGSHAYTRGTAHIARTGTASLPVQNLRGIAVDVTQGTPTTGQLPGNPPYEWNLGWLSVSNGDGMLQEQRLTRQHLVWLPPQMDLATSIGYFLNPGVTATITELLPA